MCHFITNITAVGVDGVYGPISPAINLRMSLCSFSVNTIDKDTTIMYFHSTFQVSWMLWKTKFQINTCSTISNSTNFTKNLDKIIMIDPQGPFPGTITETQYASGNGWK